MDRITNHLTKIMMCNKAPEMTSLVLLYLLMTLLNDPRTDNVPLQWQACFHGAHFCGLCSLDVETQLTVASRHWRPSIFGEVGGGERLFRPLPRLFLTFLPQFLAKHIFLYIPSLEKNSSGPKFYLIPPKQAVIFEGQVLCWDWGVHAEIEVLMLRFRSKLAPRQYRHEHLNPRTAATLPTPPKKSNSLFRGDEIEF